MFSRANITEHASSLNFAQGSYAKTNVLFFYKYLDPVAGHPRHGPGERTCKRYQRAEGGQIPINLRLVISMHVHTLSHSEQYPCRLYSHREYRGNLSDYLGLQEIAEMFQSLIVVFEFAIGVRASRTQFPSREVQGQRMNGKLATSSLPSV